MHCCAEMSLCAHAHIFRFKDILGTWPTECSQRTRDELFWGAVQTTIRVFVVVVLVNRGEWTLGMCIGLILTCLGLAGHHAFGFTECGQDVIVASASGKLKKNYDMST